MALFEQITSKKKKEEKKKKVKRKIRKEETIKMSKTYLHDSTIILSISKNHIKHHHKNRASMRGYTIHPKTYRIHVPILI